MAKSPGISKRVLLAKFFTLLGLLLAPVLGLYAQTKSFQEYQVKAVFLYQLTNFVSWPDEVFDGPNTPFKIGILGEDPFGVFLDKAIQGESVDGRQIVVERFADVENLNSRACQILFISSSLENQLSLILESTQNQRILTIGDVEEFARLGGMVNLMREGNRVHIEINVDSIKGADLKVSSKLLKLARIVKSEPSKEDE
jgi:hypothetical protein